jgi:hypothetical protein
MLFLNLVSYLAISLPLSEVKSMVHQQIAPLFAPDHKKSAELYTTLFVDGTANAATNSFNCLMVCLCLLGVRAMLIICFIEEDKQRHLHRH